MTPAHPSTTTHQTTPIHSGRVTRARVTRAALRTAWVLLGPAALTAGLGMWTAAIVIWDGRLPQQLLAGGTVAVIVGGITTICGGALRWHA